MAEIIEALKLLKQYSTDAEVAMLIGQNPKTLTVAKIRGNIPFRELADMAERENISLDWILNGIGDPERGFSTESYLSQIKENGILNEHQLSFIVDLIQRSYHNAWLREGSKEAKSEWILNLSKAFLLVLKEMVFQKKNRLFSMTFLKRNFPTADYMHYFVTHWPTSQKLSATGDIESFVTAAEASLSHLGRGETIPCITADNIAGCFSILVRHPNSFSIPSKAFDSIRTLLEPWCFWVATKSLGKVPPEEIRFVIDNEKSKKTRISLKENGFRFSAFLNLPESHFESLILFKELWDLCQSIHSIQELIVARNKILEYKFNVRKGNWNLSRGKDFSILTFRGSGYYISNDEMDSFLKLVDQITNNREVKKAIQKEIVEKYGAL